MVTLRALPFCWPEVLTFTLQTSANGQHCTTLRTTGSRRYATYCSSGKLTKTSSETQRTPRTKRLFTSARITRRSWVSSVSLYITDLIDIWRACRDGDLDLVRILIREGQDMNEQTQQLKNTPLHIAARHGHFLIVKYLVEAGANPSITNREGLSPFNFAEESRRLLDQSFRPQSASKPKHDASHGSSQKTLLNAESAKALNENIEGIKLILAKS